MKSPSNAICVTIIFLIESCNGFTASFTIAGNRSISDCINGERSGYSKLFMTTTEFIRDQGYEAEEHAVITKDRYILTMHRIPGPKGAPPVFLQHGILMSSFDWVIAGKDRGLAFLLADQGYDVWMGNARGNTYSRCHLKYTPANYSFWNFSWHEMGIYDLPAEIDYVTKATQQNVTYIGFSMGATMFYVMASEKPETAAKVKAMFGLGPVAYVYHGKSMLKYISRFTLMMRIYGKMMGSYEFLSQGSYMKKTLNYFCNLFYLPKKVCVYSLFIMVGFNSPQFNQAMLPQILTHTPAGTSLKVFIHYSQMHLSNGFHRYDYGERNNLKLYNSTTPPSYDVSKIQVPIGLFWSDNDFLAHKDDVSRLYDQLPNKILSYRIPDASWNHIDHLYGIDAVEQVYQKLLSVVQMYR